MTPKMTALRNTAKLFGVAVLAGALTSSLLIFVPLPYIGIGACVIVLLFWVHVIYEMELDKAKRLQELNNLKD